MRREPQPAPAHAGGAAEPALHAEPQAHDPPGPSSCRSGCHGMVASSADYAQSVAELLGNRRPLARVHEPLSDRALRRPEAARRARPRAGGQARPHRARRADLGARRVGPGAGADAPVRPPGALQPHLPLHHPRPRRGAQHGLADRRDVPGPDRRERADGAGVPRAAPPVHGDAAVVGSGRVRRGRIAAAVVAMGPQPAGRPGAFLRGLRLRAALPLRAGALLDGGPGPRRTSATTIWRRATTPARPRPETARAPTDRAELQSGRGTVRLSPAVRA